MRCRVQGSGFSGVREHGPPTFGTSGVAFGLEALCILREVARAVAVGVVLCAAPLLDLVSSWAQPSHPAHCHYPSRNLQHSIDTKPRTLNPKA